MSLSKLQELVMDREVWLAAVHEVEASIERQALCEWLENTRVSVNDPSGFVTPL